MTRTMSSPRQPRQPRLPGVPAPRALSSGASASPGASEPDARHELGRRGEDLAAKFLLSRGFRVIERNWRPATSTCRVPGASLKVRGELDIVAWEGEPFIGGTLCFVEVKARASGLWGTPGQAVDAAKQRQIVRLAQAYLALHGAREPRLWDVACRFDVVEVWLPQGQTPRIALHRAAFDSSPQPRL